MPSTSQIDRRKKDQNWEITDENGSLYSGIKDAVSVAVLMDIRDELQRLNRLLHCSNFLEIPRQLRATRIAVEGLRRDRKPIEKKCKP